MHRSRRGFDKIGDPSCACSSGFVSMFEVELMGILAHGFSLELWASKPAFVLGVVALATEGAVEIILFDCLVGGGGRRASVLLFIF